MNEQSNSQANDTITSQIHEFKPIVPDSRSSIEQSVQILENETKIYKK